MPHITVANIADHSRSLMRQIATEYRWHGVVHESVCVRNGHQSCKKRLNRSRCHLAWVGPHNDVTLDLPKRMGTFVAGQTRHACSQYTKGPGSLRRRCSLLSN